MRLHLTSPIATIRTDVSRGLFVSFESAADLPGFGSWDPTIERTNSLVTLVGSLFSRGQRLICNLGSALRCWLVFPSVRSLVKDSAKSLSVQPILFVKSNHGALSSFVAVQRNMLRKVTQNHVNSLRKLG